MMADHICSWNFCAHCDYFIVFAKLTLAGFSTFVGVSAGWQEKLAQSIIILLFTAYFLMLRFKE